MTWCCHYIIFVFFFCIFLFLFPFLLLCFICDSGDIACQSTSQKMLVSWFSNNKLLVMHLSCCCYYYFIIFLLLSFFFFLRSVWLISTIILYFEWFESSICWFLILVHMIGPGPFCFNTFGFFSPGFGLTSHSPAPLARAGSSVRDVMPCNVWFWGLWRALRTILLKSRSVLLAVMGRLWEMFSHHPPTPPHSSCPPRPLTPPAPCCPLPTTCHHLTAWVTSSSSAP